MVLAPCQTDCIWVCGKDSDKTVDICLIIADVESPLISADPMIVSTFIQLGGRYLRSHYLRSHGGAHELHGPLHVYNSVKQSSIQ